MIFLLLFLLWGQCLLGMAVLSSCIFRRVVAASIGNYMLLFVTFFIANTLNALSFRAAGYALHPKARAKNARQARRRRTAIHAC